MRILENWVKLWHLENYNSAYRYVWGYTLWNICLHNSQHAFHQPSQRLYGFPWISERKRGQSVVLGEKHQGHCAPGFASKPLSCSMWPG